MMCFLKFTTTASNKAGVRASSLGTWSLMSGILGWLDWLTWDYSLVLNNSYNSIKCFINILLHAMLKNKTIHQMNAVFLLVLFVHLKPLCIFLFCWEFTSSSSQHGAFAGLNLKNATQNILHNLLKVALWKFPPLSDYISVNDVHMSCGVESFSKRHYLFCRRSFVSARLQSQQSVDVTKH